MPLDQPTPQQSNAVIDDALKTTAITMLLSAALGGGLKATGMLRRPASAKKTISTPVSVGESAFSPNVIKLPYPEEDEDEKKASVAEHIPFLGRDPGSNAPISPVSGFLAGQHAFSPWSVPWFMPALTIGGTAAFMGGSSLVENLLKNKRKKELENEVEQAQKEFEQALESAYDPKVVGLQKAGILKDINEGLEKLAGLLKVAQLYKAPSVNSLAGYVEDFKNTAKDYLSQAAQGAQDAFSSASRSAYETAVEKPMEAALGPGGGNYNLLANLGGFGTGLLGTTLLASPLLAGYLAYKHYDRQNPTKLLQERLREKQYDRLLQNAPEAYVERAEEEEDEKKEKKAGSKPGLWDRIHAKRQRGEKPAKPGDSDYPDKKSWEKTTKESSAENLQPGTEEFNSALYKHLYGKKKTKDPQPGTEEFNSALYKHLYGKEKPKATNESYKKKED
jgi:hypothetical protein